MAMHPDRTNAEADGAAGRWLLLLLCAIALAFFGGALRAPGLTARPMHIDEAVQAVKTGTLLEHGTYHYDAREYHGPLLYYAGAATLRIAGIRTLADAEPWHLRAVPLAAGVLLILVLAGLAPVLDRAGAVCAALLAAVSPALVFYSTDYIQEMLLTAALAGTLAALARWTSEPRRRWLVLAGVGAGLMFASKETWVVVAGVGLLAWGCAWLTLRRRWPADAPRITPMDTLRVLPWIALPALGVAALFYSSLGTHPGGFIDALTAWTHYFARAGGEGSSGNHAHPWFQYLIWYGGSDGLILLMGACQATLLIAAGWRGRTEVTNVRRALALTTLGWFALLLPLVFSAIPYKTPWAFLPAHLVLLSAAGHGLGSLWNAPGRLPRVVMGVCLGAALVIGIHGAQRYTGRYAADPRNPFAYAQAGHDVERLAARMEQLAVLDPAGRALVVQVMAPEYWPLPWYLRAWSRVGWRTDWPGELPRARVWLLDPALAEQHAGALPTDAVTELYALRPGVFIALVVPAGLWQALLAGQ